METLDQSIRMKSTTQIYIYIRRSHFIVASQCTKNDQLHTTEVAYFSDEKGAELE
jgi:hypothetical protein